MRPANCPGVNQNGKFGTSFSWNSACILRREADFIRTIFLLEGLTNVTECDEERYKSSEGSLLGFFLSEKYLLFIKLIIRDWITRNWLSSII